ncbi:MAG: TIGR01777 family oxidoreductase [Marinobacter sp.]|nr:TIGR01777 family oxidoreductase [Marinobacter sp.]
MKRILVTGGTGFIGRRLCQQLLQQGWAITVLSRQPDADVKAICGRVERVEQLATLDGAAGFDAVINLAGEGIADRRWSESRKQALRSSRVDLTDKLVASMATWHQKPAILISGSAVGFYGDQGQQAVDEDSTPHLEFTHELCRDWELAATKAEKLGVRVCLSRTGIVAGPGGGFLQRMLLPFKLGLGGRLGSGQQYMPWVHREDVVNALLWMLDNDDARGPYNLTSPTPVTNREFTACLAAQLHRPAILPAPAFALQLMLGEMARLLLTGQRALPSRLLDQGFQFRFSRLPDALGDVLGSQSK